MVKRKRSLPSNNTDERPTDGLQQAEMSRESLSLTPSIGCGTRSRPQNSISTTNANSTPNNSNNGHSQSSANCSIVKSLEVAESTSASPAEVVSIKTGPRTSARVSKRVNREAGAAVVSTSQTVVPKKAAKQSAEKCSPDRLKTRRSWELWSNQETDAFYEALCEYGRDFENIQLYIAHRNKRKSGPPSLANKNTPSCGMTKNKEQVRHFYYRTWNKIKKSLEFSDDVKKPTQELYGLINYGEMRKKLGLFCITEKYQGKLNELIMHGSTSVKYKGKKFRLKTPVCRALKKLNNIEDSKEPETSLLPNEVCIELRPANNAAFANVQSLAQNPNLRTRVPYSRRLSALFTYLEKRWKPTRLKHREQVLVGLGKNSDAVVPERGLHLRVVGHSKGTTSLLSVAPVESSAWSGDLSLQSHLARIDNQDICDKRKSKKQSTSGTTTGVVSTTAAAAVSESKNSISGDEIKETPKEEFIVAQDEDSTDPATQAQRSLSLLKTMLNDIEPNGMEDGPETICSSTTTTVCATTTTSTIPQSTTLTTCKLESPELCSSSSPALSQRVPSKLDAYLTSESSRVSVGSEDTDSQPGQGTRTRLTLGQLLGSMATPVPAEEDEEVEEEHVNSDAAIGNELEHSPETRTDLSNVVDLEQIRTKGWTLASCQSLTFGEICLMLDLPEKLTLEYDWEYPETVTSEPISGDKCNETSSWLSQVLSRLLSISNTHLAEFKAKQATNISPAHRTSRNNQNAIANNSSSCANSNNSSGSSNMMSHAAMTPPSSKSNRRLAVRLQRQNSVPLVSSSNSSSGGVNKTNLVNGFLDASSTQQQQQQTHVDELDQHVFVVPIGAAPRCANKTVTTSLESVKDQLDRLVPASRRAQRGLRHRKPLVVQRPLLPRQDQGSTSGMTLVHLLPSSSARTLVLPSAAGAPTTVQIAAASPCTASSTPLSFVPTSTTAVAGSVVTASPSSSSTIATGASGLVTKPSGLVCLAADSPTASSSTQLVTATSLRPSLQNLQGLHIMKATTSSGSMESSPPVHISIPETPHTAHLPSILDISLAQSLSDVSQPAPASTLLDFGDNSNSSLTGAFGLSSVSSQHSLTARLDPLVSARQLLVHSSTATTSAVSSTTVTPPHSPNGRFKVSSPGPDSQWLNGEGGEFSLSSLLGNLDSPMKNPSNPSNQGATNNNNSMDSASCLEARLGPVVDSHLHCLINENSVDYVAKFADLAAQISSTENKCV